MFEVGDLVFAKLKGHRHPHWPAVVIESFRLDNQSLSVKSRTSFLDNHSLNRKFKTGNPIQSDKKRKVKDEAPHDMFKDEVPHDMFNVNFFGTGQTAIVAADSIVLYNDDSVQRFNTAKNRKYRFFKDALAKIAEMKSKIELKSSKHSSRITRSAVKNMVNRKLDIDPLILKTEYQEQDEKQLMTDQLDIQESSIPVVKSLEEFDKIPTSDHLILPQKSFEIVNFPFPSDTLQSKSSLDHPKDHQKRAHSSSSSLSIPMGILLSSPIKDTQSDPVANNFNHQDITLSSPVANHRDQEDISVFAPVTDQEDISVFAPVTDQEDISVFAPVTDNQDIILSFPTVNHHNYEDIAVSTPLLNHSDLQDIPITNHHNQQDISVSSPLKILHNHQDLQDTPVPTPVVNHHNQQDISVSSPIKILHDDQDFHDTSLPIPVVNHCDHQDISVSITEVNHPRSLHPLVIVSSRHSHDPQEQLNSPRSCSSVPEVNNEAFLHPSVISSSPSHDHQKQLNSQSCSSFPLVHNEVCSHPIVLSPNHSYDYNNKKQRTNPICTSFPGVNDESHLESSSSSNRNDFPSKLFIKSLCGDDHKTSNDTKVHRIKSSEWSPIRKKRKLTIESDNASNGLQSSSKLDMNTTSVQDHLNKSSSSWVEETLDESSLSWVQDNLNKSSSSWVEETLDQSSSSWVEETLEKSFSCEDNPCELSWVEPSFPEDLDDCTSVTCIDINKLMVGQNNFNKLDDSNDIKNEVLVSDQKFSDSDEIEPRNSDFNILSEQKLGEPEEQKLPYSDSQYFISNLLTGFIGHIIDAFFDDDFEAYCCDELFSVAQLEEHIKKFHRDTPANVTIKTCEW